MLCKAETIYQKANTLVQRSGTRDTLQIADDLGIFVHYIDDFKELLGIYTYRHKERHILLNANMEEMVMQMVCGHEIAHDITPAKIYRISNENVIKWEIWNIST